MSRVERAHARLVIAGALLIMGLGRLGLFSYANATTVPAAFYGGLMVGLALLLGVTATRYRSRLAGRLTAGFAVCALAGLGADVWATGGTLTSALMLFWLAAGLLVEAVGQHEC